MIMPSRLPRQLRSARAAIALAVLAPVGMLVVCTLLLLDLRRDAYDKAEQTSRNLLQVIEKDIDRNFEIFDLTLQGIVENLKTPGIVELRPDLLQRLLFDRAAMARDMGVTFVLDERGDIAVDEGAVPPRKGNYADRDYFRVHKARADLGLYVGRPLVSRLTGEPMLPFSRRINKPDGTFGGVAYGSLKLSYFSRLFDQIGLGRDGAINLYLRDGTRVMRHPYREADVGVNIAGAATFERFVSRRSGSFVGTSVRDGIERHYVFTQVGDLPLVLNVALSTREIETAWRAKAVAIGGIVVSLCGLTIILSLLFGRELHRRATAEAELARLSHTDALTGLPNRRWFDQAFARCWGEAVGGGGPLSLLVVDADHFKRFNDRYGHAVGDEVLKGLADCLSGSVHRPHDAVCRLGGEEFVILLPDTDQQGAVRVANTLHEAVARLTIPAAGIGAGSVTVSVGLAVGPGSGMAEPEDLYRRADAALYEAKAGGRNQTRCAPAVEDHERSSERVLRLVSN
ncbi:sensor domain-containing diguanylate cyclase [Methylobacterium sp. JK268]